MNIARLRYMARRKLKRNIAGLRNQPRPPPDSFPEPQEDHPSPTLPREQSPCANNPADGNDSDVSFDEENPHYKRVDSSLMLPVHLSTRLLVARKSLHRIERKRKKKRVDSSKEYWQYSVYTTGGLSTDIVEFRRRHSTTPNRWLLMCSTHALWMSFDDLWIVPGGLWVHIA